MTTDKPEVVVMNEDKMQAEFEAWAGSKKFGLSKGHFKKDEDGEYLNFPTQCYWDVWQASRAAPAVQGEPIPAGFALIKLDSRTGKPLVTSEMKVKHIGEYWWDEEAPYYDEHGDLHDYVARHAVPWSLCKEIYKSMASTAMLSVQPADQQPAPDVAGLVEVLEFASKTLTMACLRGEVTRRIDTALAAYRNQGGEL